MPFGRDTHVERSVRLLPYITLALFAVYECRHSSVALVAQKSFKEGERESEHVNEWFKTFRRKLTGLFIRCTCVGFVVHDWLDDSCFNFIACRRHLLE